MKFGMHHAPRSSSLVAREHAGVESSSVEEEAMAEPFKVFWQPG
jgi:hypothetical protein